MISPYPKTTVEKHRFKNKSIDKNTESDNKTVIIERITYHIQRKFNEQIILPLKRSITYFLSFRHGMTETAVTGYRYRYIEFIRIVTNRN